MKIKRTLKNLQEGWRVSVMRRRRLSYTQTFVSKFVSLASLFTSISFDHTRRNDNLGSVCFVSKWMKLIEIYKSGLKWIQLGFVLV